MGGNIKSLLYLFCEVPGIASHMYWNPKSTFGSPSQIQVDKQPGRSPQWLKRCYTHMVGNKSKIWSYTYFFLKTEIKLDFINKS